MSLKKNGSRFKKQMVFCQRLLSRDEFGGFCDRLREDQGYLFFTHPDAVYDELRGGFRVPVSRFDCFPEFLMEYPYGTLDGLRVAWQLACPGNKLDLAGAVQRISGLGRMGVARFMIRIGLEVGQWSFLVDLDWEMEQDGASLSGAGIEYRNVGNLTRTHPFEENLAREMPLGFLKSSMRENLPFLNGIGLECGWSGVVVREDRLLEFQSAFFRWCADGGKDAKVTPMAEFGFFNASSECLRFATDPEMSKGTHWDEDLVREIVVGTGGKECVFDFDRIVMRGPEGVAGCDEAYHAWLGRLVGLRTPSGRATCFPLARFRYARRRSEADLMALYRPEGVAIALWTYGRRPPADAPAELRALLPGEEWVPGVPPGGDSFPFPVFDVYETWELVPETDSKATLRFLRKEAAKWILDHPVLPGSLENQLRLLGEAGLRLRVNIDCEDFLEYRGREWYEEVPFLRILIRAGQASYVPPFFGLFGKHLNHVNFQHRDPEVSMFELLRRFDLAGMVGTDPDGSCAEACAKGGRRVVEFLQPGIGENRTRNRWELDGPLDWVTPEFFRRYDELLQVFNKRGLRVYSLPLGDGNYIFGAFESSEVARLNAVLPVPFTLYNP